MAVSMSNSGSASALRTMQNQSQKQLEEQLNVTIRQAELSHRQAMVEIIMQSNAKRAEQATSTLIKLVSMVHDIVEKASNSIR
jgi:hypothetical protein